MKSLPPLPRITAYREGRRRVLADEGVQATIVRWWLDGYLQREIAGVFGYKNASPINLIIMRFIARYVPERYRLYRGMGPLVLHDEWGYCCGEARKPLGHEALRRYRSKIVPFRLVVSR